MRAGYKREVCEIMGTSAECKWKVMGRKKRERGKLFSSIPINPFIPAFLNNYGA